MTSPQTPAPTERVRQALLPDTDTDAQFNFRVSTTLKAAFLAATANRNTTGTEALTRFMLAYVTDTLGTSTLHLDGTECPVSQLVNALSVSVLHKLENDKTLDSAAIRAVWRATEPLDPKLTKPQ